jgi:hypothetical protein
LDLGNRALRLHGGSQDSFPLSLHALLLLLAGATHRRRIPMDGDGRPSRPTDRATASAVGPLLPSSGLGAPPGTCTEVTRARLADTNGQGGGGSVVRCTETAKPERSAHSKSQRSSSKPSLRYVS